jgi:transcriptional repressor NrdR
VKCPYCGFLESKVIDSRPADEGASIRRRRECLSCHRRFTTYETVERLPMMVIKKDNSRESFDRNKVLGGIIRACEKRPVSYQEMEKMAHEIEQTLQSQLENEINSSTIGELVMERLKTVDDVAYVRFASVYRQFKDIGSFMDALSKLLEDRAAEQRENEEAEEPEKTT